MLTFVCLRSASLRILTPRIMRCLKRLDCTRCGAACVACVATLAHFARLAKRDRATFAVVCSECREPRDIELFALLPPAGTEELDRACRAAECEQN